MLESHLIISFLFVVIQFLIGIFANSIIVVVNGIGVIKQRKMTPLGLLLSCLAVSRIFMQLFIFLNHMDALSLVEILIPSDGFGISSFINQSELWFATWLGVFYCAKIANISHPLFFWLKMRISKLVPWLILGSLLYASTSWVFHSKYIWPISQNLSVGFSSENMRTQKKESLALDYFFLVLGFPIPLFIFLVATLLLVFSLGRHTRQMRNMTAGTRDPRMSAHIHAVLSILSFLILFCFHYTMELLISFQTLQFRRLNFLFVMSVLGMYPSIHSTILILGNPKLKQNAKKFLLHNKCCL
ncbi:PREDICTED: taste receptor type 2 member 1 [Propithecus coquereli]|uniref:taste receptor type 2 member 1 n=1 Tax=Propithecus coquereli TaxID=379532 RepID=UPI00063ED461|nr:PREDICTED: taste receptor type 2 member 1 [Propithecus coquereli]